MTKVRLYALGTSTTLESNKSVPESNQPDFADVRRRADKFARQAYSDVFARFERIRSGLDVNVPIVSAIIEREHNSEKAILVQTRWQPDRDPLYSLKNDTLNP